MKGSFDSPFQNVLIAIVTSIALLLTAAETLTPLSIFIMCIPMIYKIEYLAVFSLATALLRFSVYFIFSTSFILMTTIIFQWKFVFSRSVQITRIAINILFTISAIVLLCGTSTSQQNNFIKHLPDKWNSTSPYIEKYQNQADCNGLEFSNFTESRFCDEFVLRDSDFVYGIGRKMLTPIILFWISVVIYNSISIVIVVLTKTL